MVEPLVSSLTGDMALSSSEFILLPSTELLLSGHPSGTLMLQTSSPMTSSLATTLLFLATIQPSTASLESEEFLSTMQPVTLQPSVLIPTVVTSSESLKLLLPFPSSELPILLETSLIPPTSYTEFVLSESSLLLELFPSIFLSEIPPKATSSIPETSLREMHVTVATSDITELTVSPQPSLFSEVTTEIVPESAMTAIMY